LSLIFGFSAESTAGDALLVAAVGTLTSLAFGFGIARVAFRQSRMTRDLQLERLAVELDHEARDLLDRADTRSPQVSEDTAEELDREPLHREGPAAGEDQQRQRGVTRDRSRD